MTTAPATAASVIRSYYAISGLYTLAASLIWGINTLFLLDAGLDLFQVFLANAGFSAGMVIFEIPTGVIADTLGRRASVLIGSVVLAATTGAYVGLSAWDASVAWYVVASIGMGLGFTFQSGAVEAWLVDALDTVDPGRELDGVFARGQSVTAVAMLFGTVGGGFLGEVDLAVPFVGRAVLLVVLFLVATRVMRDVGFSPRPVTLSSFPREARSVARAGISFGWRVRSLRLLMVASFVETGFFFWAFYVWQPHLLELLGRNTIWVVGVFSGLISLAMMGGNALVGWLTGFCGKRTTLILWSAAVKVAAAVGIGLTSEFWVAGPLFLVIVAGLGVSGPVRQAYFHGVVPGVQRATVLSFDSMVGSAGGAAGQVGLGALGDVRSVQAGFLIGGLVSLVAVPLTLSVRKMEEGADVIVGRRAVPQATCAVPDVNTVRTAATPEIAAEAT
jgi:MFS family permease